MNTNELFRRTQAVVNDVPLLLVGTGASIPFGIPGMSGLAEHLQDRLREKHVNDSSWVIIAERLENGVDLESAMTNVTPPPSTELMNDIVLETWKLINEKDLLCGQKTLKSPQSSFSKLIHYLFSTSKSFLNIITTNYDRLIEYSCDKARVPVVDGFNGYCFKRFSVNNFMTKNAVNLIKVHGSLDYFKYMNGDSFSVPFQQAIPEDCMPDIIPPGSDKYRDVLLGVHRDLLQKADSCMNLASSYLCIGYGFNDEQIQEKLLSGLRDGKPILVVTKRISDQALGLISINSNNYVVITEDSLNNTMFNVNGTITVVNGSYWTIDGLMKIVVGE